VPLARDVGGTVADLLVHDQENGSVIEALHADGEVQLCLTGNEAARAQ
jgi:hypothetical protein